MVEYVCPSCGSDERVARRCIAVVEWVGKFVSSENYEDCNNYNYQDIDPSSDGLVDEILTDVRAIYLFRCLECDYQFNEPITDKEFKQRTKKE